MARPRPRAAPVTRATWPSRPNSGTSLTAAILCPPAPRHSEGLGGGCQSCEFPGLSGGGATSRRMVRYRVPCVRPRPFPCRISSPWRSAWRPRWRWASVVAALVIPNWATSAGPPTRTLRFTKADDAAVSARVPAPAHGQPPGPAASGGPPAGAPTCASGCAASAARCGGRRSSSTPSGPSARRVLGAPGDRPAQLARAPRSARHGTATRASSSRATSPAARCAGWSST